MLGSDKAWLAPAKLNLFLKVLNKRPDGYHNLQTVFQLLDYGDEMRFSMSDSGNIERDYDFVSFEQDLCVRAVRALEAHVGEPLPVHISLNKKLPIGGGVGGGSSDAATTLMAVNTLWGLGISRSELMQLGTSLGADVPIFVFGQSAWAEGIGDQLNAIELPQKTYLVVTPDVSVSTAKIFANKELTLGEDAITIRDFLAGSTSNDFEPIVRKEYSLVNDIFNWLQPYGKPTMTGTGASVFLEIDSDAKSWKLVKECPKFASVFVAKSVQKHPEYDGVWPSG